MKKVKLTDLSISLNGVYDTFICSASFEDRCLSIPSALKELSFTNIFLLENEKGSKRLRKNAEIIRTIFPHNRVDIKVDLLNIGSLINSFIEISSESTNIRRVLIDVTTFTHEELLICLKLLLQNQNIKDVMCVYNNASEYCAGEPIDKKWLSQGAEMIHPVWGYSGECLPSRKNHLVVIVGYECSRAFGAISDIEPSSISLIYGSSTTAMTEKDKEANMMFKCVLKDMTFEYPEIDEYEFPCNDPDAISSGLETIYDKYANRNLIIVPLNTKMSTIGVVNFSMKHDDSQVCYAPALFYNEDKYSVPGDNCYIYKLK